MYNYLKKQAINSLTYDQFLIDYPLEEFGGSIRFKLDHYDYKKVRKLDYNCIISVYEKDNELFLVNGIIPFGTKYLLITKSPITQKIRILL